MHAAFSFFTNVIDKEFCVSVAVQFSDILFNDSFTSSIEKLGLWPAEVSCNIQISCLNCLASSCLFVFFACTEHCNSEMFTAKVLRIF